MKSLLKSVNAFRQEKPVWFWVVVAILVGSFGAAAGPSYEPADKAIQETDVVTDCFPKVESRLDKDEKAVVEWALEKIRTYAPSEDWWCERGIRALHASATDQSVFFKTWSDFGLNESQTYQSFYETCRVFMEPFDSRGVNLLMYGTIDEIEVTIDGREKFKSYDERALDGEFDTGEGVRGGCTASVYFPHVAAELETLGWKEGIFTDPDRTFDIFRPSVREDYYCQYERDCS